MEPSDGPIWSGGWEPPVVDQGPDAGSLIVLLIVLIAFAMAITYLVVDDEAGGIRRRDASLLVGFVAVAALGLAFLVAWAGAGPNTAFATLILVPIFAWVAYRERRRGAAWWRIALMAPAATLAGGAFFLRAVIEDAINAYVPAEQRRAIADAIGTWIAPALLAMIVVALGIGLLRIGTRSLAIRRAQNGGPEAGPPSRGA